MSKYYAITAGEYSDYHIVHITTDKKLAEAYVKLHADRDYEFECMRIEEFDDLVDQCDIQDTFNKTITFHPYLHVNVKKSGAIDDEEYIKNSLRTKNVDRFYWSNIAPKAATINEWNLWGHFEMWVQVDKYDYDYDKIIKVVMDTRAKMLAEKEGL